MTIFAKSAFGILVLTAAIPSLFLVAPSLAVAQDAVPSGQSYTGKPAGYEKFFREIEDIIKKYPEAGKRFTVYDVTSKPLGEGLACPSNTVHCCQKYAEPCCTDCATRGCCEIIK
jgi:hypothetical protein